MINFMETASGLMFDFENPHEDMICIGDIAASLSKLCRFNGHTSRFYSVGHHSLIIADRLYCDGYNPKVVLQGLMHDATEAYIGDMVSPLKAISPEFCTLEDRVWRLIAKKYGIRTKMYEAVLEADKRILNDEREEFMPDAGNTWPGLSPEKLGVAIGEDLPPSTIEALFNLNFCIYSDIIAQKVEKCSD